MSRSYSIDASSEVTRLHPLALTAFIVALVGIPVVGLVTGPVAMILAGMAIGQLSGNSMLRGKGLAVAALAIGLGDVVLWTAIIGLVIPNINLTAGRAIEQSIVPSKAKVEMAPDHIRRALEANVLLMVDRQRFLRAESFSGSGILIGIRDDEYLILTNRHVVDPYFNHDESKPLDPAISITAFLHDGSSHRSYVWWVEPHGVDLALVATGSCPEDIAIPEDLDKREMEIGQKVFAVGNPHELSWSYNEGVISGIRETVKGPVHLKILQTQTPINQGNSGGGLYSADGTLLGIVTWTKDKAQAEGISFAITYGDFLTLYNSWKKGLGNSGNAGPTATALPH
jgi:S1-C subfamily serine protease